MVNCHHDKGVKRMELKRMTDLDAVLPSTVEFNYEELKKEIDSLLERYKGKEKTDASNYAQRKAERAALNKLSDALDGERKAVKKRLLSVMDGGSEDSPSFSDKIKFLVGSIEMVVGEIDAGIKEYEEEQKKARKDEIFDYIECHVREHLPEQYQKTEWLFQWATEQMTRKKQAWENLGMPLPDVYVEIDREVKRCVDAIGMWPSVLREDDSESTKVAAQKALMQKFDMNDVIATVNECRERERIAREREEERRRIEEAKMAAQVKPIEAQVQSEFSSQEPKLKPKMFSVVLKFVGTQQSLCNLYDFIKMNQDLAMEVVRNSQPVIL
jgi:hypothetical protein